jgi:hypothetical protein
MHSLVKQPATFDELARRVKERARRERLHREIGALRTKHAKVIEQQRFNWRARSWRLLSKIKRLEAQLVQPELFL